ncbi:ATP-dependent helicase HepA [Actinomyces bovis]|uniref:ATP-dependent helicase HepA n=1 Tax=Actinomyces bovis TaxID=1658 RepID=A0ABY1VS11_9ACTO|nr:DEAD/DEAH box helicase [Actinomyces bovis]SPT55064.1 ATP-dependent helicase HepA [Actinomyces bovis]VEG56242.1 ATP-dependent helicase HepA [Actinomyces israelii]
MARTLTPEDWPAQLTDTGLAAALSEQALRGGRALAEAGRVGPISVGAGGEILTAQVKDSHGRAVQTMAFSAPNEPQGWKASCSCHQAGCQHVAATLLAARTQAGGGHQAPDWRAQLDALLSPPSAGVRMGLEVGPVDEAGTLGLLPLIRGAHAWRRQDCPWTAVAAGTLEQHADHAQLACLADIAAMAPRGAFFYTDDRIRLDQLPARIWQVLREAVETGLALRTAQHAGQPVDILPGLRGGVVVVRDDDGAVVLSPALDLRPVTGLERGERACGAGSAPGEAPFYAHRSDGRNLSDTDLREGSGLPPQLRAVTRGPLLVTSSKQTRLGWEPELLPLGQPVHAYALWRPDGSLALLPLEQPGEPLVARLLEAPDQRVVVPTAEVPQFEEECLERLGDLLPVLHMDKSLQLPEPIHPVILLRIDIEGDEHRATTSWFIRYQSDDGVENGRIALQNLEAALGGEPALSGLTPTGKDADRAIQPPRSRDLTAEAAVARSVLAAFQDPASELGSLWRPRSFTGMDTAHFMTRSLAQLRRIDGLELEIVGEVPDYRAAEETPIITTEVADGDTPDWFSLRVRVRVGSEEIPLERLMTAVARREQQVLLDSGTWVSIDRPEIYRLAALMEEGRALADPGRATPDAATLSVSRLDVGYYAQLVALGVEGEQTAAWKAGVERLLQVLDAGETGQGGEAGTVRAGGAVRADGVEEASGNARVGSLTKTSEADGATGTAGAAVATAIPSIAVPAGLKAQLRPYQLEGFRWLDLLRHCGLGGVLADDMGLGKTVQVLAAVAALMEEQRESGAEVKPVLVVAPTSVVSAWAEQAARFTPSLRVATVTSTAAKRRTALRTLAAVADVVVTSYAIVRLEEEAFVSQDWAWVVLDEAQFVKNHAAVTYKAVRRLRAPAKLAITGTPMENSLMDLWSILSIVAPGLLPAPERFKEVYRTPIEKGNQRRLASLRARMRPFLLRRTKEEVAADLPAKTEQVVAVELPEAHRRAYEARLIRERQKVLGLLEEDSATARFSALKSLTTLRMLALDPELVPEPGENGEQGTAGQDLAGQCAEERGIAAEVLPSASALRGSAASPGEAAQGGYERVGAAEGDTAMTVPETSAAAAPGMQTELALTTLSPAIGNRARRPRKQPGAKVQVLLDRLGPIVAEGHKALVFSQFTRYLRGVREHLEAAGLRTVYLDGATADRQNVIDSFRTGQADVFLISLKAGGFGLTLTEADYVFLLDPWWNPQAEEQAVDRAHRIGQEQPVMVYRLVAAGTIEEKVMALKEKKAELFERVVEGADDLEAGDGAGGQAVSLAEASTLGGPASSSGADGGRSLPRRRGSLTAADIRALLQP